MDADELRAGAFNTRAYAACKGPILECMGYVKAGDLLEGRDYVRELCGKCVFFWQWNEDGELIPSNEVFISSVYLLDATGERDACTDRIFQHIDSLLLDGKFEQCDRLLREIELSYLTTSAMRSFLTITHAAKDKLPSWYTFYLSVRRHMIPLKDRKGTQKLIGGFV